MNEYKSIFDMLNDSHYREVMLDALCHGLPNMRPVLEYIIDNKLDLFKSDDFNYPLYEGDDMASDLILPAVRRVYGNVFVTPPTLLKEKRLELFQLLFDIDEFIDYFIGILSKVKTSLEHFDMLDRTAETLQLIVDNYVAYLVDKTRNRDDIISDIRDIKLRRALND